MTEKISGKSIKWPKADFEKKNPDSEILWFLSPAYGIKSFPFFYGPKSEMLKGTIFHSCHTYDVTWRSFCCAFQIKINLIPSNPFN